MSLFRGYVLRRVLKEGKKACKDLSGRVLDLGCGRGDSLQYLYSCPNLMAIGLDISERQLDFAKTLILPVVRGDFFFLPFKDHSFSTITCFNTLYNFASLTELLPAFCEMVRVLSHSGKIVLDVRNRKNPVLTIKYWWHMKKGKFPTVSHSPDGIVEILKRLGCYLEKVEPVGFRNSFLSVGQIMVFRKGGS